MKDIAKPFSALRNAWAARDNLLDLWSDDAFEWEMVAFRMPFRTIFMANTPEAVNHVLIANADNYRKSIYTERALKPLIGDGMFISHGELWKRQRRMATPAFHSRHIKRFAADMTRTIGEMLARWEALADEGEVELSREMAYLTSEVVCRTMFSEDLGDGAAVVFESFSKYKESLGRLDVSEAIGLPRWVPRLSVRDARRAVRELDRVLDQIIDKRKNSSRAKQDLLSLLMEAIDPETGQRMSGKHIRDEVAVLILAGHETAAKAMCWSLYLLSQAPEVETRLCAEVDEILNDRTPDYEDVQKLVYTRAVVQESMRLYPPLYIFSREAIADDRIGDIEIPKGSMIIVVPWLLHRHALFWKRPKAFEPERFLPENLASVPKNMYLPFGAGPRTCLGSGFAMTEMTLALAMIAQKFRLRLREGHVVEPLGRLTLRPKYGLPMSVQRRSVRGDSNRSGV